MLDGPQLPKNPIDTLLRPEKIKLLRALLGPYCHPHHVQSSPYSSRLLTMLTTPEGGATVSEPRRGTMVRPRTGTNRSRGRSQPVVGGGSRRSCRLVWLWRLEEEETEETRQTFNVNQTVKVGTIIF